jgi:biotin transport system substrate-specific component
MIVRTSLFTALIIAGAYIRIPIGPVPVALASFFVLLSGLLLGPGWGTASVALYLLMGAVGLPVFSGGGGVALFAGPTGGYLAGYLPAAFVTGIISCRKSRTMGWDIVGLLCGTVIIYLTGVPRLKMVLETGWSSALAAGVVPFLIGDGIKVAAAASLRKVLHHYVPELFPSFRSKPEPEQAT